jgi:aminoglycoside phosphotransferase (APT) family kinase protein
LGQNILLNPLQQDTAVIDWEYATIGDPAQDLAIVTRGVRNPFQLPDGLPRLLLAYREAGGGPLEAREVRVHELLMALRWYREALAHPESGHGPREAQARVRQVLDRAKHGP